MTLDHTAPLELIGIVASPPWPEAPQPLRLVPCGARAALFAPAASAANARDAARAALDRTRHYEKVGVPGRILPVAPGAAIPIEEVAAVLAASETEIARAVDETGGASEFHLRVTWAEDRVLAAFRDSPELAPVLAAPRVRAGDLAQAVTRLAGRLAAAMDADLAATGLPRVDQPRGPGMLLHRALLVAEGQAGLLDETLAQIDALWSEGLSLRLIGPMPPVSFALFDAVRIDAARRNAAWSLLGPVGATGAAAIAAARRAALRRAAGPGTADAIRAAARDLAGVGDLASNTGWRLERRTAASALPSATVGAA
jgi:hypothetical protein